MRKALIVGINNYPGQFSLHGCVNDAKAIAGLLNRHADGSLNFDVMLGADIRTKAELKSLLFDVFKNDDEISLFYFSGHGCITGTGGYIMAPDFARYDEGISMDDILKVANLSPARHKIVILDCCHAGAMGNPSFVSNTAAYLEKGVVILASSRSTEPAVEVSGHGVFTALLIDALKGGAADIGGEISPSDLYSYIDKALGAWKQRPVFKANIARSVNIRSVSPLVAPAELRKIPVFFPKANSEYPLDPSYEYTTENPDTDHINVFKTLHKMQLVGLVEPVGEEYLYWAAINSKSCRLTPLGTYYWKLLTSGRI